MDDAEKVHTSETPVFFVYWQPLKADEECCISFKQRIPKVFINGRSLSPVVAGPGQPAGRRHIQLEGAVVLVVAAIKSVTVTAAETWGRSRRRRRL